MEMAQVFDDQEGPIPIIDPCLHFRHEGTVETLVNQNLVTEKTGSVIRGRRLDEPADPLCGGDHPQAGRAESASDRSPLNNLITHRQRNCVPQILARLHWSNHGPMLPMCSPTSVLRNVSSGPLHS